MRRKLPAWSTGLAFMPLGFYFGFITTAIPILLSAHGVTVDRIEEISSKAFFPTCSAFVLCPILDVRFTKRTYCFFFATLAALCLGVSTFLTQRLTLFTVVVMTGCVATVIFGNAIAGWLADVTEDKHYDSVGAWSNVANLGAAGSFGALTVVAVRHLPQSLAAVVLGLVLLSPTILLFFIPLTPTPTRNVKEAFSTFFRDLWAVIRKPGSIFVLILFLSPASCFALTNIFSGMGKDFHASEALVTKLNGPGVAIVCSIGCLVSIWLCSKFPRRVIYLVAGFGGAIAALALLFTQHTPTAFICGVLAYNFCQGLNYTTFSALTFEIVGPVNPLSGTQMALLAASANAPISYMSRLEGIAYKHHGIPGMFGLDAGTTLVFGTGLLIMVLLMSRRQNHPLPHGVEVQS